EPVDQLVFRFVALLVQPDGHQRIGDHQRAEKSRERAEKVAQLRVEHRAGIYAAAARYLTWHDAEAAEKADDVFFFFESALHVERIPRAGFFVFGDYHVVVIQIVTDGAEVRVARDSAIAQIFRHDRPGATDRSVCLRERPESADIVIELELVADRPG